MDEHINHYASSREYEVIIDSEPVVSETQCAETTRANYPRSEATREKDKQPQESGMEIL